MSEHHVPQTNHKGQHALAGAALEQILVALTEAKILDRPSRKKYSFNNKLIWEVAYDAVRFSEKRRLHNLVGLYIESLNEENLDNVADLLLHHFESGQNHQKTVYYGAVAGDRAARMFAPEESIHSYNRALEALKQLPVEKPFDSSLVFEKCGDVLRKSGAYEKAIEYYDKALAAWHGVGPEENPEYVPWAITTESRNSNLCRKISISHEQASKYDEAYAWINRAVEYLPENSEKTAPRVYAAKSGILRRKGAFEDSIEWGKRATAIAEKSGNVRDIAYAHNILANTFIETGELHEAVQHLKKSVSISAEEQDFVGISTANNNLGACYMYLDNLDEAIQHYKVALEADIKTQNDAMMAIDHNNLGEAFIMKGNIERSEALFEKVINAHREGHAHDALAGYALMNISRCRLYSGNLDEAKNAINQGLSLIENAGVITIYLEAQLQKASVLLAHNNLKEAESLCNETILEIESQGFKLLEAKATRVLAKIYEKEGDIAQALEKAEKSIDLAENLGSKYEEGKSLNEYARMLIITGEATTRIQEVLTRAEDIFTAMGATRELSYTQYLLNQVDRQQEQE